jgi:hypothetical protein
MRSSKKKKHIFMPHLDNGHIVFAWGGSWLLGTNNRHQ